ncbi:MAG: SDR family NAD(P)-dependent oxidoreductase [Deltaproteobacteria bacterium]|nr:SDR family NAD(P)-dependent oxidoreductase [Deltaproteobacteria bacterium]
MLTILISGATRGLGRECARLLIERGDRVVIGARDRARGATVAAQLGAQSVGLDVTDPATIAQAVEQLATRYGKIDALINNAGIALDGFDGNVARTTLATNTAGAIALTDACLPLLADGGRIVMVSSGMGQLECLAPARRAQFADPALTRQDLRDLLETFVAQVNDGSYAAGGWPSSAYRVSKVALNAYARLLHRELSAHRDLRVISVCPGWVRTEMGGSAAPREVGEGAASIVWAIASQDPAIAGGFYRDGEPLAW